LSVNTVILEILCKFHHPFKGFELGTDLPSAFEEKSNIKMIGFDMIKRISEKLYKETGIGPNDVQVYN
jgi:hypothetical protein